MDCSGDGWMRPGWGNCTELVMEGAGAWRPRDIPQHGIIQNPQRQGSQVPAAFFPAWLGDNWTDTVGNRLRQCDWKTKKEIKLLYDSSMILWFLEHAGGLDWKCGSTAHRQILLDWQTRKTGVFWHSITVTGLQWDSVFGQCYFQGGFFWPYVSPACWAHESCLILLPLVYIPHSHTTIGNVV